MSQKPQSIDELRQSFALLNGGRMYGDAVAVAPDMSEQRLSCGIDDIDARLMGGLECDGLHEIRCSFSRDIANAFGFLFALVKSLDNDRPIIWISDPATQQDTGLLFPKGLAHFGFNASRIIHVSPTHLDDAFWAAGEAAISGAGAATIFHIKGNPKAFNLSVSRKLMLRAQKSCAPLFIIRQAGEEEASSAATRWHVAPAQSQQNEIYPKGLGHMRLAVTLEKNRNGQTGKWHLAYSPKTRSLHHAASTLKPTHLKLPLHASCDRQDRAAALG